MGVVIFIGFCVLVAFGASFLIALVVAACLKEANAMRYEPLGLQSPSHVTRKRDQ